IGLCERCMLVSSGVINHLRALGATEAGNLIGNGNVGDTEARCARRTVFFKFPMKIKHASFVTVGAEKLFRMTGQELAAEFRANGAGGAGDEHSFVANLRAD